MAQLEPGDGDNCGGGPQPVGSTAAYGPLPDPTCSTGAARVRRLAPAGAGAASSPSYAEQAQDARQQDAGEGVGAEHGGRFGLEDSYAVEFAQRFDGRVTVVGRRRRQSDGSGVDDEEEDEERRDGGTRGWVKGRRAASFGPPPPIDEDLRRRTQRRREETKDESVGWSNSGAAEQAEPDGPYRTPEESEFQGRAPNRGAQRGQPPPRGKGVKPRWRGCRVPNAEGPVGHTEPGRPRRSARGTSPFPTTRGRVWRRFPNTSESRPHGRRWSVGKRARGAEGRHDGVGGEERRKEEEGRTTAASDFGPRRRRTPPAAAASDRHSEDLAGDVRPAVSNRKSGVSQRRLPRKGTEAPGPPHKPPAGKMIEVEREEGTTGSGQRRTRGAGDGRRGAGERTTRAGDGHGARDCPRR
ncbi:unnamed protein product [Lota lota]